MSVAGALADPDEVRTHLIAAASARESITYSELLGLLGHNFSRPKMRALCVVLTTVDEETAARGEPELAVLVVRQSDAQPGQGWWVGCAEAHGYNGPWEGRQARRLIKRLQARAFDYWQASR
ncbi:MAG: ribose-phosphate pyrophosphokinase [Sphingomicrobium sp.]